MVGTYCGFYHVFTTKLTRLPDGKASHASSFMPDKAKNTRFITKTTYIRIIDYIV